MKKLNRRNFIKQSTMATLALGLGSKTGLPAGTKPVGAHDDIRLAVVGVRGKGNAHLEDLVKMTGVRIAALCDVDPEIVNERKTELDKLGIRPKIYSDVRKLLEDKDIDAVLIATPNHWHAPITIWACQAGKDVYVEKPVCHNIWEGRKMVEAARKYKRIVQAGTQARSNLDIPAVIEYIKQGNLGKILWVHGLWYKLREDIGLIKPWYPEGCDYDVYCGPSPMVPLRRNRLHYDWHWMWDTGNGDLCNLGNHIFDVSRWMAGVDHLPPRILSLGERFAVNDAGETPNTQLTIFDYKEVPIIIENRGLPMKPGVNAMDHLRGIREGVVVQCENGYYAGYHGGWIWDNDGKRVKQFSAGGAESHLPNFFDCMRHRKSEELKAPIETGFLSTVGCLIGNISYRLGKRTPSEKIRETLKTSSLALETFGKLEKHLEVNEVNLQENQFRIGPWIEVNREEASLEKIESDSGENLLEKADALFKDAYRPPFIVHDQV
jgi:predicted dehydrogenase